MENTQEKNDNDKEELDFENMTERQYQEWIWSLKRVETVTDVDGTEHKLNFLPFIL